jgi:hypothetical protein
MVVHTLIDSLERLIAKPQRTSTRRGSTQRDHRGIEGDNQPIQPVTRRWLLRPPRRRLYGVVGDSIRLLFRAEIPWAAASFECKGCLASVVVIPRISGDDYLCCAVKPIFTPTGPDPDRLSTKFRRW